VKLPQSSVLRAWRAAKHSARRGIHSRPSSISPGWKLERGFYLRRDSCAVPIGNAALALVTTRCQRSIFLS